MQDNIRLKDSKNEKNYFCPDEKFPLYSTWAIIMISLVTASFWRCHEDLVQQ